MNGDDDVCVCTQYHWTVHLKMDKMVNFMYVLSQLLIIFFKRVETTRISPLNGQSINSFQSTRMREFLLASSITSYHINHPTHFIFLCLHFHYLLSQPSQWGPVCSSSISCWFPECQDQRHTHVLCSKAQNSWDILPWARGCLQAGPTTSNPCPHGVPTVETVGLTDPRSHSDPQTVKSGWKRETASTPHTAASSEHFVEDRRPPPVEISGDGHVTAWAHCVWILFSVSNAGLFCLMWIFVQNQYLLSHIWNEKQSSSLELCPVAWPWPLSFPGNPPSPTGNSPAPISPFHGRPCSVLHPPPSPSPHSRLSRPRHYGPSGARSSVLWGLSCALQAV